MIDGNGRKPLRSGLHAGGARFSAARRDRPEVRGPALEARHRALLVFPISNLLATRQMKLGDLITVDCSPDGSKLTFFKEEQGALVKGQEEHLPEASVCAGFHSQRCGLTGP